MTQGDHWEWRAFGRIPDDLKQRILALPAVAPDPWPVEDRYLYTPGCAANVKLRADELKLKRLIARARDLERWLEDPAEVYPFPLARHALDALAAALAVALPVQPETVPDQAALLALLIAAQPPVQEIVVRKTRRLRTVELPGVAPPVLLDLAEISSPQTIWSIALEHPQAGPVRQARALLGLDAAPLTPMSYLDALARWTSGGVLTPQPATPP